MRNEIKKKNKEKNCALYLVGERKERKKMITSDNPTIIYCCALYHVKENMLTHLKRQWRIRFGHWVVSNVLSK
jgi:hypothetical protein